MAGGVLEGGIDSPNITEYPDQQFLTSIYKHILRPSAFTDPSLSRFQRQRQFILAITLVLFTLNYTATNQTTKQLAVVGRLKQGNQFVKLHN